MAEKAPEDVGSRICKAIVELQDAGFFKHGFVADTCSSVAWSPSAR